VTDTVYLQIRQAILDGGLAQGQALVESSLSEMFAVSRTPVREALHRLEQDGLVERTDRGLRVSVATEQQILEMYRARILLEGAISEDAANNRTEYDLQVLQRCLDSGVRADAPPDVLTRDNDRFHEAVWAASHNKTLADLVARVDIHLRRYPQTTLLAPGRWERAIAQHGEIVSAIRDRDADRARRAAELHHTEARDIRVRMWQDAASSRI
jgi:DNA-binding GntR family transcriptional regulator